MIIELEDLDGPKCFYCGAGGPEHPLYLIHGNWICEECCADEEAEEEQDV